MKSPLPLTQAINAQGLRTEHAWPFGKTKLRIYGMARRMSYTHNFEPQKNLSHKRYVLYRGPGPVDPPVRTLKISEIIE